MFPHVPLYKKTYTITMLGNVMPSPADVGLKSDSEGPLFMVNLRRLTNI